MSTRGMCWIAIVLMSVIWWVGFVYLLMLAPVVAISVVGVIAVAAVAALQDTAPA